MGAPFAIETTWSRSTDVVRIMFGLFGLSFGALVGGVALFKDAPVFGGALLGFAVAMWIATMLFLRALSRGQRALVRASPEGVRLGNEFVPRPQIATAYFVPSAGRIRAHVPLLDQRGTEIARVHVDGEETANRLLAALGLGAAQHAATFRAVAPGFTPSAVALVIGMIGGLALFSAALFLQLGLLAAVGVTIAIAAPIALVPASIRVGADGLLVAHRLGIHFIPWDDVDSIEPYARGVVVNTRDRAVKLPITSHFSTYHVRDEAMQAALLGRAQAALQAYRRGDSVDVAARLTRRGRTRAQWIRDLFNLSGDFRAAPVDAEALFRIVESPTAAPTARAGAAFVLARTAAEPDRARLRIAAEACVAPRLRIVLDRAADGAAERELRDAIAEVEDVIDERPGGVASRR
ncbi:MAG: hypothetical protein QM820_28715 [Minicystis sp.]